MLKSEKQKIITLRLDEVLKPLGFRREIMDDIRYLRRTEEYVDSFYLLLSSWIIEGRGYSREHKEIADILWKLESVAPAQIQSWSFKKERYIMTIYDYSISSDCGFYGKKSFDMKLGNWFDIDSPEALNDYLDWYISYLLGEGQEFLDYYSYLPNILKKMDELDATNTNWWENKIGILAKGPSIYFTGLIISKLCNDPKYEEKLERFNAYYSEDKNEEKLPTFEKLKEILEHVEPRYNV